MRPAARALLALAALGLAGTRAVPPPTPPAGFYRSESEGQEGPTMVRVVCFARGHGNAMFGEGAASSRPGDACGLVTVTTLGDGWQSRQRCVLSGRTANIVKAEIAGKGTFYRVRVPAQSRNDAINLCTSYKAAGGNCFVSR